METKQKNFTLSEIDFVSHTPLVPLLEPRVPLLERSEVPVETAKVYDQLYMERGTVPNLFKALANVPGLVTSFAVLSRSLMEEGFLKGWYKELLAVRIASLNRCDSCAQTHRQRAQRRGATLGQVVSIDGFEHGPFTEREKAGFRYAGLLHQSGHAVNEAAFEAVGTYFTPPEIVELTTISAAFEMLTRISSSLRISAVGFSGE